jgi:hypothetical protein
MLSVFERADDLFDRICGGLLDDIFLVEQRRSLFCSASAAITLTPLALAQAATLPLAGIFLPSSVVMTSWVMP